MRACSSLVLAAGGLLTITHAGVRVSEAAPKTPLLWPQTNLQPATHQLRRSPTRPTRRVGFTDGGQPHVLRGANARLMLAGH